MGPFINPQMQLKINEHNTFLVREDAALSKLACIIATIPFLDVGLVFYMENVPFQFI